MGGRLIRASVPKRNWEWAAGRVSPREGEPEGDEEQRREVRGRGGEKVRGRRHCPERVRAPKDIKVF